MKRIITALLLVSSSAILAQDAGKIRKWSLGTSLVPIFQASPDLGVCIKRYMGGEQSKGAIRAYTGYYSQTDDANGKKNNKTSFRLNLGYEWIKHEGPFSVNFGADLCLRAENSLDDASTTAYKTETGTFGIKPFIGAIYRINGRLSLSTEIGKLLATRNSKVYADPTATAIQHTGSTDDFFTGQLLMINYHF